MNCSASTQCDVNCPDVNGVSQRFKRSTLCTGKTFQPQTCEGCRTQVCLPTQQKLKSCSSKGSIELDACISTPVSDSGFHCTVGKFMTEEYNSVTSNPNNVMVTTDPRGVVSANITPSSIRVSFLSRDYLSYSSSANINFVHMIFSVTGGETNSTVSSDSPGYVEVFVSDSVGDIQWFSPKNFSTKWSPRPASSGINNSTVPGQSTIECAAVPFDRTGSPDTLPCLVCSYDSDGGKDEAYLVEVDVGGRRGLPKFRQPGWKNGGLTYDPVENILYWSLRMPGNSSRRVLYTQLTASYHLVTLPQRHPSLDGYSLRGAGVDLYDGKMYFYKPELASSSSSSSQYQFALHTWIPSQSGGGPSRRAGAGRTVVPSKNMAGVSVLPDEVGGWWPRVYISTSRVVRFGNSGTLLTPDSCQLCSSVYPGSTSDSLSLSRSDCYCNFGEFLWNNTRCRAWKVCSDGEYIVSSGNRTHDTVCRACTPCQNGSYISGACNGQGFSDRDTTASSTNCIPCDSCPAGSYINTSSKFCDGAGIQNNLPLRCIACRDCGNLQYKSSLCSGRGVNDTVTCAPCSSCNPNQYISRDTCMGMDNNMNPACETCLPCQDGTVARSPCNGATRSGDQNCTACSRCRAGQYTSGGCNGTTIDSICSDCKVCAQGMYTTMQCGGKQNTECAGCPRCGPRKFIQRFCNGTAGEATHQCADCSNCSAGFYLNRTCTGGETASVSQCAPCSACPANHYVSALCPGDSTNASGSVCSPCGNCGAGNYITGSSCDGKGRVSGQVQCSACAPCPAGFYPTRPCDGSGFSADQSCAECPSCPAGKYVAQRCPGDGTLHRCADCRSCLQGQYISGCNSSAEADLSSCLPCRTCGVGEYLSTQCGGSSLSDISVCQRCRGCSYGEYMSKQCLGGTSTTSPDQGCLPCRNCSVGQYIATRCDGSTFSPEQLCKQCSNCSDVFQVPLLCYFCVCFSVLFCVYASSMFMYSSDADNFHRTTFFCVYVI